MNSKTYHIKIEIPAWSRRAALGILLLSIAGVAEGEVKNPPFEKGDPISSMQVNENFEDLDQRITALEVAPAPTGAILAFGGTIPPDGYLMCDGTAVPKAMYPELFEVIGVAFGEPNATLFNLPDLQGRFLRGVANDSNNDPDKLARSEMQPGGFDGNQVGSVQSSAFESHNHGGGDHNHLLTDPGHTHSASNGPFITASGSTGYGNGGTVLANFGSVPTTTQQTTGITVNGSGTTVATEGGNETRPTNAYVNYIIKL